MSSEYWAVCECTDCECRQYVQVFDETDPEYDPNDMLICEFCLFGEHAN